MALFDDMIEPDEDDVFEDAPNIPSNGENTTHGLLPPQQNRLCIGYDETEQKLVKLFNAGRLPHAMIFSGPTGIGKSTFAFRLARFLLTREQGGMFSDEEIPVENLGVSLDHPAARRADTGSHADFLVIGRVFDTTKKRLSNDVPVDEVRKITPFLRKTSAEGGWRVVIIDDAQYLNRSSQNAILKILEEPPKKTLLILITDQAGRFLPTIRSRCQIYDFTPLTDEQMSELIQLGGYSHLDPDLVKMFAAGRIGRVQEISEAGGDEVYDQIKSILSKLPSMDTRDAFDFSETVGRDKKQFPLFMNMLLDYISQNVRLAARGHTPNWPEHLTDLYTCEDWLQRHEKIEKIVEDTSRIHLDMKQAVLEVIWALQKDTK